MRRRRSSSVPQPPAELGHRAGLAYALFLPEDEPLGGVVVLHGAGSCKESHFDFARALRGAGMAAVAFDQRGHGDSEGAFGPEAVEDIATIAELLPAGPRALRGSSMGGYLALIAAAELPAQAVVAICPAASELLRRGLAAGAFQFRAQDPELDAFLAAHDALDAVAQLDAALLLMHAEGDEQVPVEHSQALFEAARSDSKRLIVQPGGHHRSVQHDPELLSFSVRFIARALSGAAASDTARASGERDVLRPTR